MKKIMFNDTYGLTEAVLSGRKTMTRRVAFASILTNWSHIKWDFRKHLILSDGCVEVASSYYALGEEVAVAQSYKDCGYNWDAHPGWANKMYTAAILMPHVIRITGIKVERLQVISGYDIRREGIWFDEKIDRFMAGNKGFFLAKEAFAYLIDKVSGKGTWERNPWVFVYSFELVR